MKTRSGLTWRVFPLTASISPINFDRLTTSICPYVSYFGSWCLSFGFLVLESGGVCVLYGSLSPFYFGVSFLFVCRVVSLYFGLSVFGMSCSVVSPVRVLGSSLESLSLCMSSFLVLWPVCCVLAFLCIFVSSSFSCFWGWSTGFYGLECSGCLTESVDCPISCWCCNRGVSN